MAQRKIPLLLFLSLYLLGIYATLPSQVIDLTTWSLQLPYGPNGQITTIDQPKLGSFENEPYFYVPSESQNGVIFQAFVNGTHTADSDYVRTELREMNGNSQASWSNTEGTHTMTVKQAYLHVPQKRPEIVGAQIHAATSVPLQVRLNIPSNIVVYGPNGDQPVIVENYALGTVFTLQIIASDGQYQVFYNDELKYTGKHSDTGCYFKTGAYVQSNLTYDAPSQYGEVIIYDVTVVHK
eukprot:Phypoly_transcript_18398.p1 GENE.Phypoly_transcript_18398~~Phypoly_transcript_18398.p1  ORF type:complete len:238 (+),score=22.83 Phypoly_transcript_18398:27-740(+)